MSVNEARPLSITVISILLLGLFTVGGLMAHIGGLVQALYPTVALALAILLYVKDSAAYIGYTWWIWFVTPEVRRLVDFQIGYHAVSIVSVTPMLVTGIAVVTLLKRLPLLKYRVFSPFLLGIAGLFYSFAIGVIRSGFMAASYDLLNWVLPVIFGCHIALTWKRYPWQQQEVTRAFRYGVIVMGAYGLIQFFILPPWDRSWMLNSGMNSLGLPLPLVVRVFSTMNSAGPFAEYMLVGLLLLLTDGRWSNLVASGLGYAAFVLSLVRTAWGGWVVAVLSIFSMSSGRTRFRIGMMGLGLALVAVPVIATGPIAAKFQGRINLVLSQDTSYQARIQFYRDFWPTAMTNVLGEGMGTTGMATRLSDSGDYASMQNFDSGIMNIPFALGWLGSLPYMGGAIGLLIYAVRAARRVNSSFVVVVAGAMIGLLVQLLFGNTMVSQMGLLYWGFGGLVAAAQLFNNDNAGE